MPANPCSNCFQLNNCHILGIMPFHHDHESQESSHCLKKCKQAEIFKAATRYSIVCSTRIYHIVTAFVFLPPKKYQKKILFVYIPEILQTYSVYGADSLINMFKKCIWTESSHVSVWIPGARARGELWGNLPGNHEAPWFQGHSKVRKAPIKKYCLAVV